MGMSLVLRVGAVLLPLYFIQPSPHLVQDLHESNSLAFQEVDVMDLQEVDVMDLQETDRPTFALLLRQIVDHLIELDPFLTMGFTLAITSGTILWSIHQKRLQKMLDIEGDRDDFKHSKSAGHLAMGEACVNVCNMPTENPLCADNIRDPARVRKSKGQLDWPRDTVSVTISVRKEDATTADGVINEQGPVVKDCSSASTIRDAKIEELSDCDKGIIEQICTVLDNSPSASSTRSESDTKPCIASASSSSTSVSSSSLTLEFVTPQTSPRDDTLSCTKEDGLPVRSSVISLIKSEPKCRNEAIMYLEQKLVSNDMSPLHRSVLLLRLNNHKLIRENSQRRRLDLGLGLNAILSPLRNMYTQ